MKKSCKKVNIRDPKTIYPFVYDCISRHARRYDFRRLLYDFGMKQEDYERYLSTSDITAIDYVIWNISIEAAHRISVRELNLHSVIMREMRDHTTGKLRIIGKESAFQQIFDYIAVGASAEIWDRRLVPHQASSITGRGQIYGSRMIQKWIEKDNRAEKFAKKHNRRYTRKCKYFAKLDIQKCFPSMSLDVFIEFFSRDCGNDDLIWLWRTLLSSHRVQGYTGFMIGALPSQWGAQYLLTFIYRYAMNLVVERRNQRIKLVSHMIFFMDDMSLFSSSRKNLKLAIRKITEYAKSALGLTIKSNWAIYEIDKVSVDMMGYVVHRSGRISIRGRDFVHARRMILRFLALGSASLRQANRLNSYKGYFKYSDCRKVKETLHIKRVFDSCSEIVSYYAKKPKEVLLCL